MNKGLYLVILLLFSCNPQVEHVIHKFDQPGEPLTVEKMNNAYNHIYYIGNSDRLYDIDGDNTKAPYDYFFDTSLTTDTTDQLGSKIKNVPLEVFVDTSSSMRMPFYPDIPEDLPGSQASEWMDKNKKIVSGYPVYIRNLTNEITSIPVTGVATEIIQEAKDENGNWRPIEFWLGGFCGLGTWSYILKPGYFIITSVYQYHGEFKTEMRIKFRTMNNIYYSNTFHGQINKSQFKPNEYFNTLNYFLE